MKLSGPMLLLAFEALVDGRALKWEHFQLKDLTSEEEMKTLTVEEIKKL